MIIHIPLPKLNEKYKSIVSFDGQKIHTRLLKKYNIIEIIGNLMYNKYNIC